MSSSPFREGKHLFPARDHSGGLFRELRVTVNVCASLEHPWAQTVEALPPGGAGSCRSAPCSECAAWECGDTGTLAHGWRGCGTVRPLWEAVWQLLRTGEHGVSADPAIPLPGVHPSEVKPNVRAEAEARLRLFTAARSQWEVVAGTGAHPAGLFALFR